ncbi:MAG: hypothetical protein A2086_05790 [Spirochaetes bacterium GWD1_27_9]|nr:MAG: hypothetical protein A2Z98_04640 [Spirochaetes bacterium GWB1_27_13]OHD35289.1 MAG: hypothetical protein A2086_05790 [Spirochaetes bacterium GWD1_27_9]
MNKQSLKFKILFLFTSFLLFLLSFLIIIIFVIFTAFLSEEAEKIDNYTSFLSYMISGNTNNNFENNIYEPENYLWEIIITDKNGKLLYISNEDFAKIKDDDKNYKEHPSVKNALLGNWGFKKVIVNNKKYYTSSKFVVSNDWIIIVQVPEKIILNNVIRTILPILILILMIILFFLSISLVFISSILKPINILTDHINQYTLSKENEHIEYKKNDEIGLALKAFEKLTIERKKLEKEILEISENERKRIGRDLHDDLGQILTGISFQLLLLEQEVGSDKDKLEIVNDISDLTVEAINKTKIIARGLCPVNLLVENGFIFSIEGLAKSIEKTYNIKCIFYYDNTIIIDDDVIASNLYHIILETVNNSLKHSNCKEIEIGFFRESENVKLIIKDNGIGFEYKEGNGMGLKILKYRANLVGAVLNIDSIINVGTTISCIFKLYNTD